MAPKREQKAKSGGTSSTKTSEKDELVQARAVKRAERVVARLAQAEERKEAVRSHYLFVPPTQNDVLPPNDKESHHHACFREMLTFVRVIIARPSTSTMTPSKSMVLVPHTCQTWLQHG
jgi:hypothetical protein